MILRELLLRRRIDFVLVAAPAGMVRQWQDELEAKFGLAFTIIDRDYLIYSAGASAVTARTHGRPARASSSRIR